jgi:hypothetical protein
LGSGGRLDVLDLLAGKLLVEQRRQRLALERFAPAPWWIDRSHLPKIRPGDTTKPDRITPVEPADEFLASSPAPR